MSEEEEVQNWRQERIKEDQEDQEDQEEEENQENQEKHLNGRNVPMKMETADVLVLSNLVLEENSTLRNLMDPSNVATLSLKIQLEVSKRLAIAKLEQNLEENPKENQE